MAPSVVAIKMAGFTSPGERPWYPRNIKIPPIELQCMVFPFIEEYFANQADWVKRVENIMLDNPLMLGRPPNTLIKVNKESQPLISILTLLAHLRKIVIQDAAVLMDIHDHHLSEYGLHRIFQQPLFKHPMFMEYRVAFRRSIATATSPTSDSLLANTPAILAELRGLGTNLEYTIQRATSNITEECQRGFRSVNNAHQRLDGSLTNEINRAAETQSVNIAEELNRVLGSLPHQEGRQQQRTRQEPRQQELQDQEPWQQELQDQEPLDQELQDQEPLDQELIEQPGQQSPPPPTKEQQLLELEEVLAAPKHGVTMDGIYDMISQKRDLREHWKEWFYGLEGQPSIWRLNKHRGTKWRSVPGKKGNELARRYKFKRDIVFSILEKMLLKPGTLAEREEAALLEMEELLVPISLNKYFLGFVEARKQGNV
ncbi:hypothetical protein EDD11_004692 [Mortierella claussenii]|nr:hypothetical protein EDD11_004692 [Mortierella claussenii]